MSPRRQPRNSRSRRRTAHPAALRSSRPDPPRGKRQRYLGSHAVDPQAPYRYEPAPDRNGNTRNVIVFRLLAAGPSVETSLDATANAPTNPTTVDLNPAEANTVQAFEVAATDRREGQRWEASLMRQLEAYLSSLQHTIRRADIRPAGETARLITDTYDVTAGELFEIKPDSSRPYVRAAVAQLRDHRRHLPDLERATVLLPEPRQGISRTTSPQRGSDSQSFTTAS